MMRNWKQQLKQEVKEVMQAACTAGIGHRFFFMGFLLCIVFLTAAVILMVDRPMLEFVKQIRPNLGTWGYFAWKVRKWGSGYDHLVFIGVPLLFAYFLKSKRLAKLALTAILAVLMATLVVNLVRVGTGRPRPRTHIKTQEADRLTGPSLRYAYQSFPSGHTASAFAGATALTVCAPVFGWPALLSATGVGISSCVSTSHYVSDIVAGAGIGILFGLAFGLGYRQRYGPGNAPER